MKQLAKPGKVNKCYKCITNQVNLHLHLYYLTYEATHTAIHDKNSRNIPFTFTHKHSFHIHSLTHNLFENVKFNVYRSAICLLQLNKSHSHTHAHKRARPWLKSQLVFRTFSPHTMLHIIRSPSQEHCRVQLYRYDSIFARMESWAANKADNLQNSHTVTVQWDNISEIKNEVLGTGAHTGFVGPEAYTIFGAQLWRTTQIWYYMNIYLWPLPGPWNGPVHVRGPEA
jgi:hypothetical protein